MKKILSVGGKNEKDFGYYFDFRVSWGYRIKYRIKMS